MKKKLHRIRLENKKLFKKFTDWQMPQDGLLMIDSWRQQKSAWPLAIIIIAVNSFKISQMLGKIAGI